MNPLSDRINNLAVSQTLAMAALARELKAQGKDIISLSLGEPDFNTPEFIKEAAKKAIDENYSTYTPVEGYLELKEAICKKFKRDNNLDYKPSQIVVSTGAKQSLYNIAQVMLNDGDEVILPAPYWVSYYEIIKLSGGVPVEVPTSVESDFKITPEQLEAAITPKTKMMWFSSPCNPSGSVYNREELMALAKVLEKHPHVYVVSDEIYEHINFSGTFCSIASIPGMLERTITVNGVAKAFAMTGWRIGYVGAPAAIAKLMGAIQSHATSNPNSIAQKAAYEALTGQQDTVVSMREEFNRRRIYMYERLSGMPHVQIFEPKGAFYAFVDVSELFGMTYKGQKIENGQNLAQVLLSDYHVAVIPCDDFGYPDHIRLSYAISMEQIAKGLDRIENFIKDLK